jgi:hypothetical protein
MTEAAVSKAVGGEAHAVCEVAGHMKSPAGDGFGCVILHAAPCFSVRLTNFGVAAVPTSAAVIISSEIVWRRT